MGCLSSDCGNMGSELCPSATKVVLSSISSQFVFKGNSGLPARYAGALKPDLKPNCVIEEQLDDPTIIGGYKEARSFKV